MGETSKHEDKVLKMGFEYFRDEILTYLGIKYEYVETTATELTKLQITRLYMDFTFLTTEDMYIHVEFQSTNGGEADLRRFHAYEAVYSNDTGKKVITYVIFTGGMKNVKTELECGNYTYRITPVYMSEKDADKVIRELMDKRNAGEALTKEDFARLSLTPLMSSGREKKEVIKDAIRLTKSSTSETAEKSLAMLYTLADKFLEEKDLKEIKEVLAMTRIGQMLYEDGMKSGLEKGLEKGLEEGREEGHKKGLEEGREEGHKKGLEEGCEKTKIETARNMHARNYGDQVIADVLETGIEKIREWIYGAQQPAK